MPRPLVATIEIAAMQHNLSVARQQGEGARIWGVVKANAYGHGLLRGMRGFAAADGLSLIEFDNAVCLREAGWRKPILMLEGCFDMADMVTASTYHLEPVIHCVEQIVLLEHAMREHLVKAPFDVHLKLNSGMNRLGLAPAAFQAAYARLRALPGMRHISLMTHFANADGPDNPALPLARQVGCFLKNTRHLDGTRSTANSAMHLLQSSQAADWARPGIMLYGASPGTRTAASIGLQPAMTLASELIAIQEVEAGDAVGYGSRFVATVPMRIGIVACGYADGYPRQAPDGTPVLVEGIRTRLTGRVSMDMLMVDLTPVPSAHVGSAVELWGTQLPVDEVATMSGTIGYELLCAVAARVRFEERSAVDALQLL